MKVLLDENLSPRLTRNFTALGVFAAHIAHVGRSGLSDVALFAYAYDHDYVVVTVNAADFLTLAAGVELHPGLIVLRAAGLSAAEQWLWLERAVRDCLARETLGESMANTVIEITAPSAFARRELPGAQ